MTSSKRLRWLGVVEAGLALVGLGCGLGLVASLGGGLAWWLEVFTHGEPCLAGGLVVLLPWLIWRRRWIWVGIAGVLVVKAGFVLAPWLLPGDAGDLATAGGDRTIAIAPLMNRCLVCDEHLESRKGGGAHRRLAWRSDCVAAPLRWFLHLVV